MGKYKETILELINSPDYRPMIKRDLYKILEIDEKERRKLQNWKKTWKNSTARKKSSKAQKANTVHRSC